MLPRLPVAASDFPDQQARMRALAVARREMETVVAKIRLAQDLCARITRAANYVLTPGTKSECTGKQIIKYMAPVQSLKWKEIRYLLNVTAQWCNISSPSSFWGVFPLVPPNLRLFATPSEHHTALLRHLRMPHAQHPRRNYPSPFI